MATVAIKVSESTVTGNLLERFGSITGGTSDYVQGTGYVFTPNQLGLFTLSHVRVTANVAGGYVAQSNINSSGNLVLKVFNPTGGVGTDSSNPNTVDVPSGMTAVTSTSAQPNMPINPGPGSEVASSTNLSAVVFNFTAYGH